MYSVAPNMIKVADKLAETDYGMSELTLMENAARACYSHITSNITYRDKILILCGKGNNGGDGYEIAKILHGFQYNVTVVNVFDTPPVTQTALTVYNRLVQTGAKIIGCKDATLLADKADMIIDALFGVGFYGSISDDGNIGRLILRCNSNNNCKRIAIDVPSGINSENGSIAGVAFCAHLTLTLAFIKTGTLSYPAKDYCGKMILCSIKFPRELENRIVKDALIPDKEYLDSVIKRRKPNTHKGTYGRLLMFCASELMTGAGVLAANAALRSGIGLLNIARNRETVKILQHHLTEPIFSVVDTNSDKGIEDLNELSKKATALLIGCGLGGNENDKKAVFSLIKNCECPIILDADGINGVSENIMVLREAKKTAIITPHPLEFSRLTGKSVAEIQNNRIHNAKEFAKKYGCVVVLKGAGTIIAGPKDELAICTQGGPGLAKGGSGDVLSGVCASLRAQGFSAFESAVCAVYLHGAAGDILTEKISEYGFLPSDLPVAIAELLP